MRNSRLFFAPIFMTNASFILSQYLRQILEFSCSDIYKFQFFLVPIFTTISSLFSSQYLHFLVFSFPNIYKFQSFLVPIFTISRIFLSHYLQILVFSFLSIYDKFQSFLVLIFTKSYSLFLSQYLKVLVFSCSNIYTFQSFLFPIFTTNVAFPSLSLSNKFQFFMLQYLRPDPVQFCVLCASLTHFVDALYISFILCATNVMSEYEHSNVPPCLL